MYMREWLSWWSTTLPRSGSRVRVPSRALLEVFFKTSFLFLEIPNIATKQKEICKLQKYLNLLIATNPGIKNVDIYKPTFLNYFNNL